MTFRFFKTVVNASITIKFRTYNASQNQTYKLKENQI